MSDLTHVDSTGEARMVDVSAKPATARMARAAGRIEMNRVAFDAVRQNQVAKGDVLSVARVAGVMAAKRTAELVPLCHQIALSDVEIAISAVSELPGYEVQATARTTAGTGVEMEAIVAVSVTLITIYDMAKALDREMRIGEIVLLEKRGGRSGDWKRV
jgi:cyclic pyranopterin monophosphate synthase